MRAVHAIRRSSPKRARNILLCCGPSSQKQLCAHHSPDGSKSRSAESKSYMLPKMRDIPVLCSVSIGANAP
jgi:hypothetical protein